MSKQETICGPKQWGLGGWRCSGTGFCVLMSFYPPNNGLP